MTRLRQTAENGKHCVPEVSRFRSGRIFVPAMFAFSLKALSFLNN